MAGNWTTLIVSYMRDGTLPDGKEVVRNLKVQVAQFVLIKDIMYKRGFSQPNLRCLTTEEANYVMREVTKEFTGTRGVQTCTGVDKTDRH